uniref:hypothetical protein 4 n=1 Tax=Moniliophthora perniciosa TaxID=153609 RepID=UPI0000242331|nr:hypothetical protein 4 [Moniliophthora perniciosa]AAQ74293.1 hypothetical protein 4 [Moniliophthora perniciosa]
MMKKSITLLLAAAPCFASPFLAKQGSCLLRFPSSCTKRSRKQEKGRRSRIGTSLASASSCFARKAVRSRSKQPSLLLS